MAEKETKKKKQVKQKIPKTVQQSIPYINIFDNGVIETEPGVFSKAYRLEDVNFKIAPDAEQVEIFTAFGQFLNSFSPEVKFQIIIQNHNTNRYDTVRSVKFDPQKDGLNKYRSELNTILIDKISESKNNLTQDKTLIVSVEDEDSVHAMQVLKTLDIEINKGLTKIAKEARTEPKPIEERLEDLFNIYNQDGESVFYNAKDKDKTYFDLNKVYRSGLTSKDVIGPSGLEFNSGSFRMGHTYGRAMFLEGVPSFLSTDFLSDLSNISCALSISIHYTSLDPTKAIKMVRDQMVNVNAQIASAQKEAFKNGYSPDIISHGLMTSKTQTEALMDDLVGRDQKLYYITFVVVAFADTMKQLEENTRLITSIGNKYLCPIKTLLFQQEEGFNAALPLCTNKLSVKRLYTTESASIFLPYTSQELFQKNGIYYGLNQISNNLIVYSRMNGRNYNGLIFGESGAGKSFTAKNEMMSVLLRSAKNQVYVIDPEGEYTPLAKAFDGEVIELSAASKTFINPLDMDIDYGGDGDPVSMKSDYIISMIEIMLGGGRVLNPSTKSIVDRCVKNIYRGYLSHLDDLRARGNDITCDKDATPTLNNLYQELLRQPEDDAKVIAGIIEIYAQGSLATFSHRSNVETDKKFVVYNTSNLGTGMKSLGLHICLNDIWNKMIENRKKGIWTWIYIDEFYLLLQSDAAASFLMQIWKRARKWNGVPTGIMQNTEDLLRSVDARNIINNTSFVIMLSLPKLDRSNLGDLLQIPESQLAYITNSQPGHGLIYNGKTILPFKNEFPRNSQLYKIMSTSGTKDELME